MTIGWDDCFNINPGYTVKVNALVIIATFSNEDENEDEDWYDRLGPGTRTSSTAVFRRETKTFSKPVTVRGRVSSYSESHQGKCLSKNFVTSLYFSTAMKLFPMKSFCYFTIVSSQRIQIFPMKTINGLIWILWTPRSAKQSFVSRNTISLALLQPSNYHRCLNASRGVFATTWKAYAYSSNELPTHADSVIWFRDLADRFLL